MSTTTSQRLRLSFAGLIGLCLTLAGWALAAPGASAAVIPSAIKSISVTPTNPSPYGSVTTNIDYCAPGAKPGDTFTLTLPNQLTNYPASFDLYAPDGTTVVGNVVIDQTKAPAVATFTMGQYVATHPNTCGTAFFTAKVDHTLAGTTQNLTYTTDDDKTFTEPITVGPMKSIGRESPRKFGGFTSTDQCVTSTKDCLAWGIETPVGPSQSGRITDDLSAGQEADCSTVLVRVGTVGANGVLGPLKPYADATVTCTTSSVDVVVGAIAAGQVVRVSFLASATGAHVPGTTFQNSVKVDITDLHGNTRSWTKTGETQSSDGGGNGSGTVSASTSPVQSTTATTPGGPSSTSTSSTSTSTSPSGSTSSTGSFGISGTVTASTSAPASSAASSGSLGVLGVQTSSEAGLASTGAGDLGLLLEVGGLLLVVGAGALLVARRRPRLH